MAGKLLLIVLFLTALIGCPPDPICGVRAQGDGAQEWTPSTASDAYSLSPTSASVVEGGSALFTLQGPTLGEGFIQWRVEETEGGSISGGHYLAPSVSGVFHVVAESASYEFYGEGACAGFASSSSLRRPEPFRHLASATVTVGPPNLMIVPAWAVVATHSTTRFRAVSNLGEKGPVSWILGEARRGTVSSPDEDDLFYTATEYTGTFHIRAFLQDYPAAEAYLAVTVATAPDAVTGP